MEGTFNRDRLVAARRDEQLSTNQINLRKKENIMNRRQAWKIMRQQVDYDQPLHKINLTWLRAWNNYSAATLTGVPGKRDHRIEKAITLTRRASWQD